MAYNKRVELFIANKRDTQAALIISNLYINFKNER